MNDENQVPRKYKRYGKGSVLGFVYSLASKKESPITALGQRQKAVPNFSFSRLPRPAPRRLEANPFKPVFSSLDSGPPHPEGSLIQHETFMPGDAMLVGWKTGV